MDNSPALVIDLQSPGWPETLAAQLGAIASSPPGSITIALDDAPPPTAADAQLVWALTAHAASCGIPLAVLGDAPAFRDGLARLGLADALPA